MAARQKYKYLEVTSMLLLDYLLGHKLPASHYGCMNRAHIKENDSDMSSHPTFQESPVLSHMTVYR